MPEKYVRIGGLQAGLAAMMLFGGVGLSAQDAAPAPAPAKAPKVTQEEIKSSINQVTGREILTREADESTADGFARAAAEEYQNGNYDKAVADYLEAISALEKLGTTPRIAEKVESCKVSLSKAYYYWSLKLYYEAEKSADANQFDSAIAKCKQAMEVYPPAKERCELAVKKYEKMKSAAEYRRQVASSAVDPEKAERMYDINVLLKQGEAFYKTKQWDKARDKFEEVLSINPYQSQAIDYIRRANLKLIESGKLRTEATRAERIAEVAWKPVATIIKDTEPPDPTEMTVIKEDAENSATAKKLSDIVIDHIEFEEVSIQTVVKFLKQSSKAKDPDKAGINFILRLNNPDLDNLNAEKPVAAVAAMDEEATLEDEAPTTPATPVEEKLITMVVDNISLDEAIKFICKSANMKYRIEKHAVVIADQSVPLEDVETKIYPVEKEALDILNSGNGGDNAVEQYFRDRGVQFPAGAKVVYDEGISRLIVTNTPENLQKTEDLIKEMNVIDPQVLILVKFVEISLNDMEELGFEYHISRTTPFRDVDSYETNEGEGVGGSLVTNGSIPMAELTAEKGVVHSATETFGVFTREAPDTGTNFNYPTKDTYTYVSTVAGGQNYFIDPTDANVYYTRKAYMNNGASANPSSAITWDVNESLVRNANTDSLAFGATTSVTDNVSSWNKTFSNGVNVAFDVHAAELANSTELLSAPRITTMNGTEAVIRMVTEKYYPTSWSEAEISQMSSGNGQTMPTITPSIPEFGDATDEGIVLRVTPTVDADKYTIQLQMSPVVQHMVGWTDYSYTVMEDNIEVPNILKMPIIEARTVETNVSCYDGETIVLGGVIRDKVSEVDDRYPILGDLPLVGRLFQSKGKGSTKTNLLIFMTSRLVNPDGSPLREREERSIPPFTR